MNKCYKIVDEISCNYCKDPTVKFGKQNGIQRYRCRSCKKVQLSVYKIQAYDISINHEIAAHVKESCGIRSISRLLHISATTVISRIQKIAAAISKPAIPTGRTYEVDELKTCVKKKTEVLFKVPLCPRLSAEQTNGFSR